MTDLIVQYERLQRGRGGVMAFDIGAFLFLVVGCLVIGFGVGKLNGKDDLCRQWAGKNAIVYEGKCMVPTEGGGLRPARKDRK